MLLTSYECKVIDIMLKGSLSISEITSIKTTHINGFEYTGAGYFVQVKHKCIPTSRHVIIEPIIYGYGDGYMVGFVCFIEYGKLTIECHSYGEHNPPINFRDLPLRIEVDDS